MPATTNIFARSAPINSWIHRQKLVNRRRVRLLDILAGASITHYLFYRTRALLPMLFLSLATHIAEFSLAAFVLPASLYHITLLRVISITIEGSWWGITDALRHTIRVLQRTQHKPAIRREISGWVTLAAMAAALVLLGYGIFAGICALRDDNAAFVFVVAVMGVQTAARIINRTAYSATAVIQRVFFPLRIVMGVDIGIFLLGFLLHNYLQEWTIGCSILASCLLNSAVSYHYIIKAMRFLRIVPAQVFSLAALREVIATHGSPTIAVAAAAVVAMRLHDMVLMLGLKSLVQQQVVDRAFLLCVYMLLPVLRAGMGWSQVLYLDLSRYGLDNVGGLRRRLERAGLTFSLFISFILLLVAALVVAAFALPVWQSVMAALAIYLPVASILRFSATELFSRKCYTQLIALCLLQYSLFWVMVVQHVADMPMALALFIATALPMAAGVAKAREKYSAG